MAWLQDPTQEFMKIKMKQNFKQITNKYLDGNLKRIFTFLHRLNSYLETSQEMGRNASNQD